MLAVKGIVKLTCVQIKAVGEHVEVSIHERSTFIGMQKALQRAALGLNGEGCPCVYWSPGDVAAAHDRSLHVRSRAEGDLKGGCWIIEHQLVVAAQGEVDSLLRIG